MKEREIVKASVHSIIDFVMQDGDIVPGTPVSDRFSEGTRGHRIVRSGREDGYRQEVPLSIRVEGVHCILEISGRADGILSGPEGTILEEIKTTDIDLSRIGDDDFPRHWAQARLYGHMLCGSEGYDSLLLKITYYSLSTGGTVSFERTETREEIAVFFDAAVSIYLEWLESLAYWSSVRQESVEGLAFPYPEFRKGQREMAVAAYKIMKAGERILIQAPTGIGKTMGVLYPAVKALKKGISGKIFYLTAKTIARTVAEEAVRVLHDRGLHLKSVTLTAKGKICFLRDEFPDQSPPCDPDICPFARGHYSRVRGALRDIFSEELITREVVERYAREHRVCPFEFSLDISLWADIVICDFNYLFDPRVRLQRFFQRGKGEYTFLVDEAHNLVERGREMFSATVRKRTIMAARRAVKESDPALAGLLSKINACLLAVRKELQASESPRAVVSSSPPGVLELPVLEFIKAFEWTMKWGRKRKFHPDLLDTYFNLLTFSKVMETFDERFVCLYEGSKGDLRVKLACIDPSVLLGESLAKGRSAVFFSATLTPMSYYASLTGAGPETRSLTLPSPFPRENLCLIVDPTVSTRYRDRSNTYDAVARRIHYVVSAKPGNYLVYFPSYRYLEEVRARYLDRFAADGEIEVVRQSSGMSEEEREAFLARFEGKPATSMAAFAVMGGVFAEGIDLRGERLSGAVVVGVGLPQVGMDRDVIRGWFDERGGTGYDYAYTYPGFNKVQQAAGRVIRTPEDRGVVLLIDDRFVTEKYRELYPPEWLSPYTIRGEDELPALLSEFWR